MGSNQSSLKENSSPTTMRPSPKKKSPKDVRDQSNFRTISLETLGLEDFEAPPPIIMPMFLPTKNITRNWQFWTLRSRSLQKAYWKHCTLFNFEFYTRFGFGELLYKRVSDTEAEFDTSVFFKLMIVEKVEPIFTVTSRKGPGASKHRLEMKGKTFQTAECAKDMSKIKQVKLVAEGGLAKACEILVAEGDMLCIFGDINIDGADTVYLNNRFQHPVHVAHVKFDDFEEFDVKEEWYESMRQVCRDYVLVQEFMAHGEGEQAYHCQPVPDFSETDTNEIDTGGSCNILEESDNIINGSFEEQLGSPSKLSRVEKGNVSAKSGKTVSRETPEPDDMPMETGNVDSPSPPPPEIIFDPNLDSEFDTRKRNEKSEEKENLSKLRTRSHHGNYRDSSDDESVSKPRSPKKKRELPQKQITVEEITLSEDDTSPDLEEETDTGKSKKHGNPEDSDSSEATVIVPRSKSLPTTAGHLTSAQPKKKQKKIEAKKTPKKTPKKPALDDSSPNSTDKENGKTRKPKKVNSAAASKSVRHQKSSLNRSASLASKKRMKGDESDAESTDSGTAYFEKVAARAAKNAPLQEPPNKASRSSGAPENKSGRPKRACTEEEVLIISTDNESKSSSIPEKKSKKKPTRIESENSESELETPPKSKRELIPPKIHKYLKYLEQQKPTRQPSPQVNLGDRSTFKLKNLPSLPRASVSIELLPEYVDDYLHAKLFQ